MTYVPSEIAYNGKLTKKSSGEKRNISKKYHILIYRQIVYFLKYQELKDPDSNTSCVDIIFNQPIFHRYLNFNVTLSLEIINQWTPFCVHLRAIYLFGISA